MVIKDTDPGAMKSVINVLKNDDIIIMKCDTIYGITGVAPDTKDKIQDIKKRDLSKQLIMLIHDPGWVRMLSTQTIPAGFMKLWPGPLTLILAGKSADTVALRIPADPFMMKIIKKVGKPLFSTSVNLSNETPLNRIEDIVKAFGSRVGLILDSGNVDEPIPSTIVDLTVRPYEIVRQGRLEIPAALLE